MSVLTELKNYVLEKIDSGLANTNTGVVILTNYDSYEESIDNLFMLSIQVMQRLFTKEESGNPAGETPLTNLSIKIGKLIHSNMEEDYNMSSNENWRNEIRLGDLFIEAFYNCGYIEINYPKIRDSSHIVTVGHKWPHLDKIPTTKFDITLFATVPESIATINHSIQKHGMPVHKDRYGTIEITPNTNYIRAMDRLQQTPWKINEKVFESLCKERGFISPTPYKGISNKEKEQKRKSKVIEWKFIKEKSNLILKELPENKFYQYLSADYRGRFYYDEPFLNFQGSDSARGILMFHEGKPLHQEDTFWLAVHTAASYNQSYSINEIPEWVSSDYLGYLQSEGLESISVDKMTLEDRATWTKQNIDWILELGESVKFDLEAEKKVAFCAACVEWYDYSNAEGEYISHLPIPIDGSNNGWQHLGAISKDVETGELVGLVPVEIQKDFYVQTAKELIKQNDDERLAEILDAMPMKKIRKGISKRGSMTRAYSAGASKIAENMYFDCKVEDYHEEYDITKDDCDKLAKGLIKAINTVCPGPLATMSYLQHLAAHEIKEGNKEITWSTPSGFSVTYTCWQLFNMRCKGTISGYRRVNHVAKIATDKPDIRGFMCGISPNFIHSMDASHMALVIDDWNNAFGAVHDSFSTHACDVEELLILTKSKFIEMYDVDNFFQLIEDQLITNKEDLEVEQPERGSLEIREIQDSDYFFA